MKILLEAQDKVKFIEGNDFEELKTALEKIRVKYDVKIEIRNFMVDYKDKRHIVDILLLIYKNN